MTVAAPFAFADGRLWTGLRDVTDDPSALDGRGQWIAAITFEGKRTFARFDDVRPGTLTPQTAWYGPRRDSWTSSMDESAYRAAVDAVRELIATGAVYQVNVCRVLTSNDVVAVDPAALAAHLFGTHTAPYASAVHLPDHGVEIVCASPELYLAREGAVVTSRPIKGTTSPGGEFLAKDRAENVMIVDLVRNDLGVVATTGSVAVPQLCVREEHPGLAHLVSTVVADLDPAHGWADLFDATFPPGSVTGAPKQAALAVIGELEPVPRGPYCGALGWVDADAGKAGLAVGIRTFWWDEGLLRFGTGAGITWASEPELEWAETELKAARLLATVSR
jgi:para-aminobenzoate synthetase component 1